MTLTTVVFDLGETLVDETSLWEGWAEFLDIPPFTVFGVIGGLAAQNSHHQEFLTHLRPGEDHDALLAAKSAAVPFTLTSDDFYPDALPCLQALKDDGWRVVVGGNQPRDFQRLVEEQGLPVDLITSSAELGVAKPDPGFYTAVAAKAGVDVSECVHIGDRVDNDVIGARDAGMTVVHLKRGPWGYLHADDPAVTHQIASLAELPALLGGLR